MGKFKDAQNYQDKLWALVEATAEELKADGVEDVGTEIGNIMCYADPNFRRDTDWHSPLSWAAYK
jgi:hypothetical protein